MPSEPSVPLPPELRELLQRPGGPESEPLCLFAYDLGELRRRVTALVAALPDRCRLFYAMKANSEGPLLQALAPLVAGFEVASGGEITKARAAGGPAYPVIFGGPAKTPSEIRLALESGVLRLHAESPLELRRISAVATALGVRCEVLIRVNLAGPFPEATLAMAGRPTPFGVEEEALGETVALARRLPGVHLAGFHFHSLSNNLSPTAHLELLDLYRRKVLDWEREFDLRVEVLNVGGGIGVDYAAPDTSFDWAAFTDGLERLLGSFPEHWREIDFECGRFLVAACGYYATEILDLKTNHGTPYLLVRGGTHHFRLPVSWQHSHPFVLVPREEWHLPGPRPELRDREVTVVGELCTPKDVLARNAPVRRARPGDVLVFLLAGAYGWEISHHDFLSHPHPEHHFLDAARQETGPAGRAAGPHRAG